MRYFFLVISLLLIAYYSQSQCLTDLKKVLPDRNSRELGYQVALGGNYMVVANNSDDSLGFTSAGAAYLYERNASGWNFIALLKPSNPKPYLQFGNQVKMDSLGETIAISSYGYNSPTDLARSDVYIFQKPFGGWTTMNETDRIKIPDSLFSITSISISNDGNRLAIGKYYTDRDETGKVYFYKRNTQGELFSEGSPKILISPPDSYSYGASVALNQNLLAVNSEYYNGIYGVIFIYKIENDSLKEIAHLSTKDNVSFGTWVQISFKDNLILKSGYSGFTSVYVFQKPFDSDWKDGTEVAAIQLLDSSKYNLFSYVSAQVLDSLTIGLSSLYVEGLVVQNKSPTGYFETFSAQPGSHWKNTTRKMIFQEQLPVNSYYSPYASSAAWNGSQFVFTPSLDSPGSNFMNSITSMTLSNGVWGSLVKLRLPRLNSSNHYFGQSIALGNDVLLVGDPHDSELAPKAGAVYLYAKDIDNGWTRKGKILPPWESVIDTYFGGSVYISDSTIAVGAINYSHDGKVFIYKKADANWGLNLVQEIAPPADGIYQFGDQVAFNSKLLVVSAFNSKGTDGTNNTFVVYEKKPQGWTLSQVVDVHNAWLHYQTMRLDVKGDSVFVYTGLGGYSGYGTGLYIYTKNNAGNWVQTSVFSLPAGTGSLEASFKVTENHLFMGLPGSSVAGKQNVGAVAVYTKSAGKPWPEGNIYASAVIYPKDTIANGYFGFSLNSIANTLVVGAPGTYYVIDSSFNFSLRNKAGAAYVFTAQDFYWKNSQQLLKLEGTEIDRPLSDEMGWVVAADYDRYISSARFETNDHGGQAGAVYTIPTPPLVKLQSPVCSNSAPVKLFGYPFGGTWNGPGLVSGSSGIFDPASVGPGKYLLSYKTPNCTYEGKLLIEVLPALIAELVTPSQLTICPQNPQKIKINAVDSATYQWYHRSFNETSVRAISGQTSTELTISLNGYYYCVVSRGGCSSPSPLVTVNYETPDASIGPQNVICDLSNTVTLIGSPSGGTWSGTGVVNTSSGTFDPTGLTNGKYPVTYSFKSHLGCNYALADTVLIDAIPTIALTRLPEDYCTTGLVKISASPSIGGLKYFWKYQASSQSTWSLIDSVNSVSRTFVSEGNYESIVVNKHCQFTTNTIQVGMLNDLPLTLNPKDSLLEVCLDPTVTLTVSSTREDASFTWYYSEKIGSNYLKVDDGPNLIANKSGFYQVKAVVGFCDSESIPSHVKFLTRDSVWVPNVFTPNEDTLNSNFKVLTNLKDYGLTILNRWGEEIYNGNKSSLPWDGGNHPPGVYFWTLDYRDCRNDNKRIKGWVQVMK